MTNDWPRTLSPAQVARRARVGRTTVMRALTAGELQGVRDNRNAWRIKIEDVDAWVGQRPVNDQMVSENASGHPMVTPKDTPETLARLAVAEARLADAIKSITDARNERDAWKAQAERLADRPGLLARLLGYYAPKN